MSLLLLELVREVVWPGSTWKKVIFVGSLSAVSISWDSWAV